MGPNQETSGQSRLKLHNRLRRCWARSRVGIGPVWLLPLAMSTLDGRLVGKQNFLKDAPGSCHPRFFFTSRPLSTRTQSLFHQLPSESRSASWDGEVSAHSDDDVELGVPMPLLRHLLVWLCRARRLGFHSNATFRAHAVGSNISKRSSDIASITYPASSSTCTLFPRLISANYAALFRPDRAARAGSNTGECRGPLHDTAGGVVRLAVFR